MNFRAIYALVAMIGLFALYGKSKQPDYTNFRDLAGYYLTGLQGRFEHEGFVVLKMGDTGVFEAINDQCAAWVGLSQFDGENDAGFIRSYGKEGDAFFLFEDRTYPFRPSIKIFLNRLFTRIYNVFWTDTEIDPTWAISIARTCEEPLRNQILTIARQKL